jgi:ribulose-phosphate 3-epimerase
MRPIEILPSLLAADFSNLSKDLSAVADAGIGGFHCDVMDGHFVPNITFGPMIVKAVRKLTDQPLWVHLMIERPELYVEDFVKAGATSVAVHVEACVHLHRTIQQIRALGVKVGVALNRSTPVCTIEHVIGDIDLVIVMTVNPGFGGQSFIESMLPKIECVRDMADECNPELDIQVDGGIDLETAPRVAAAGANLLVAGTSVFQNSVSPSQACIELKQAAEAEVSGL